jgi:glutaredoxin 3
MASEAQAMNEITIYTTRYCPYCSSAKRLFARKGVAFSEIDVSGDRQAREALRELAGGRTSVPQIFIGGVHVGGCDELYALEDQGLLDGLLAK